MDSQQRDIEITEFDMGEGYKDPNGIERCSKEC